MASDATYERLKSMIYRRQLDAGQRLVERDLAGELGVSRIPLREGLVRLESEGLIRSIPHSASFVAPIEPRDLLEIYSMRLWLEPPATRLATAKRPAKLVRQLGELCDKMIRALEAREYSRSDEYDYRFHFAIVEASGHSRLLRAYKAAHIRIVGFYTDFLAQKAVDTGRLLREHRQIIRAIAQGDPGQAEEVAREHVQRSIVYLEQKFGMTLDAPEDDVVE
jgi:DNA-binding GntR family transcriptional regulator